MTEFARFPLTFRAAQYSFLILAFAGIIAARSLRRLPVALLFWVFGGLGLVGLVGICLTIYVVLKYPYLGLLDASDTDLFQKYLQARPLFLKVAGAFVAIAIILASIAMILNKMPVNLLGLILIGHLFLTACFILFLVLRYDRHRHPAIATFLRCTLGIGVVIAVPLLPLLIFANSRANRLLDEMDRTMESENRIIER